jgi:TRAP-type C4-dicarboxylate transport system permease small subunit
LDRLDRAVAALLRAGAYLVLPLSLLLFVQWPLRDLVQAGSREANDLAQILFALYVAVALTAATRDDAHLAADMLARRYPARIRSRIARIAALCIAAPAALFVIVSGASATWISTVGLERFPETTNPGYFLVRIAVILLAALVLVQALIDVVRGARH